MAQPGPGKRERLVTAAAERFHRHGVARTTLADVARQAEIAPGNVFYHFRTKEDLVAAVVQRWRDIVAAVAAELSAEPDPWRRIGGFIKQANRFRASYADLGCPLAGITRDVRRDAPALAEAVAGLYAVQLDWLEAQFSAAGFAAAEARRHAHFVMATCHGAIDLAYAQGDMTLITDATGSLAIWLDGLRGSALTGI